MKTCFHSHFYANFHEFYEGQLICYSFILLISIHLKWRPSINFSNFDGPNIFFPISTGPQSQFQNGKKVPGVQISVCQVCSSISLSTIYINVCFSAALIAVSQTSAYASSMNCDLLTYISRSSDFDINLQGAQWLTCH